MFLYEILSNGYKYKNVLERLVNDPALEIDTGELVVFNPPGLLQKHVKEFCIDGHFKIMRPLEDPGDEAWIMK